MSTFRLCFQQIVAFLGVLVYKFYGEELREMFGYEEHPYGFYTMAGMHAFGPFLYFISFSHIHIETH